jgi:hypothetical protein
MGRMLESLLAGSPVRRVHTADGIDLFPLADHQREFDELVRILASKAGSDYVAFPRSAGSGHYDALLVVQLDD